MKFTLKNLKHLKENVMYFDNDQEFEAFCVIPIVRANYKSEDPMGRNYPVFTTFDLSSDYYDELSKNTKFCIRDENSKVLKRNCVSCGIHNKPVQNVIPFTLKTRNIK